MYKVSLINNNEETVINVVSVRKDVPRLKSGTIKQGINTIDSFTFAIEPDNPGYDKIKLRTTLVNVLNVKTNKYEFEGRVLVPTQSMGSNDPLIKSLVCESELGYLMDSTQVYGEYHDITVRGLLETIIAQHNSQVEDYKKFTVGIVNVIDPNDSLYRYLGYDKTLDTIKDKLISRLGGELRIRKENGVRYLDYLQRIGSKKDTVLKMNKNLKTIEQKKDPTSVFTRVMPLGEKLNGTEERLNISTVNNGNPYLNNIEGQSQYGINTVTICWDDVTKPENLITKGLVALNDATKVLKQYKINALELALIEKDPDLLEIGCDYRTVNPLMNIDEDLRIIEKTIDIFNPKENQFTIGDKFEKSNERQGSVEKISSYVQSMMTGNGNLNGSFISGYMDLLRVQMGAMADSAEKQQAKAILFEDKVADSPSFGAMALGTQGFMISDELDSEGQWIWKTFGNGKGFTADLIVAGTLLANMIKGGTLSSINGKFKLVLDNDGKMTIYDKDSGFIALEFENRTIKFFDFLNSGQMIGQIETERGVDEQGNATGTPSLATGIKQGSKFSVVDLDDGGKSLFEIYNKDSNGKRISKLLLNELSITGRTTYGGMKIITEDGKAGLLWGDLDCNGHGLRNVWNINMAKDGGGEEEGVHGTVTINQTTLRFNAGVLVEVIQN